MNLSEFLKAFVPIFVAVDVIGLIPFFLSLTDDLDARQKRAVVLQSSVTAIAVAIGFIFLGRGIFRLMGITVYDFMVAGGVLLFIFSTIDLVFGIKLTRGRNAIGAVPIGMPLMVGPAVLTTSLMLVDIYGLAETVVAVVINLLLAAGVLLWATRLERLMGQTGSRVVSKVASLLLAAIAVMMVRKGLEMIIIQAAVHH